MRTSDDGAKGAEEGLLHGRLHPLAEDHHRREQHVQRAPPPQLHANAVVAARGPVAGNGQPAAASTILSFLPGMSGAAHATVQRLTSRCVIHVASS